MKLDLSKLARILGQLILAAPTVIAAVKPLVDAVKGLKEPSGQAAVVTRSPTASPPP